MNIDRYILDDSKNTSKSFFVLIYERKLYDRSWPSRSTKDFCEFFTTDKIEKRVSHK